MTETKKKLEEVKTIFCARFKLPADHEGSAGLDAINAAIEADYPDIAGLKRLLLEQYELYPQYAPRVRALLNSLEVPASEAEAEVSDPASEDDTASAKSVSRMNKAELIAEAEERGLEVADDATVVDLREMLREEE